MSGPNRKSAAARRRDGNPGKQKQTKPGAPGERVECPTHLTGDARAFWKQIAPILTERGLLNRRLAPAFEELCSQYGLVRDLVAAVAARRKTKGTNYAVQTAKTGYEQSHPLMVMLQREREMLRKWLREFGMTAASLDSALGEAPTGEDDPLVEFEK